MKKGFILSFEGGEACGKTTQIKLFKEYLDKKGIDYIALREPGGTEVGESIRNILLHQKVDIDYRTEVLLFNAARAQIIEEKIKPALKQGKLVLLDRFYHSTLAYQGYALGRDTNSLKKIINYATDEIKTDLTLLLNLPAEVAYQRKVEENQQDRFEERGFEFYKNTENAFLEVAKNDPNVKLIDATKSIEEVHKQMVETFEKHYNSQEEQEGSN